MSMEFKETVHQQPPRVGMKIWEIWLDGKLVGTIYPGDVPYTMRILSKHLATVQTVELGLGVAAVMMQFKEPGHE
jgi:hypothetical protein